MTPNQLDLGSQRTGSFVCESTIDESLKRAEGARVFLSLGSAQDELVVNIPERDLRLFVRPAGAEAALLASEVQVQGRTTVIWLAGAFDDRILLKSHSFTRCVGFTEADPLVLLVTEEIEDSLPREARGRVVDFLKQEFLLDDLAIALTGGSTDYKAFRLIGRRRTLDMQIGHRGFPQTRTLRHRSRNWSIDPDRLTLFQGTIQFQDATLFSTGSGAIGQRLERLLGESKSYLAAWDIYNQLEEFQVQEQLKEIGRIGYEKFTVDQDESTITFSFELKSVGHRGFALEASGLEAVPFEEDDAPFGDSKAVYVGEIQPGSRPPILKTRIPADFLERYPPPSGSLQLAARGDKVRIQRRKKAREAVVTRRTPLLTLGLLLEEGNAPVIEVVRHHPLSDRVRRAFQTRPTDSQIAALDIALNTPDIALIQGPPGTGKTTVIRALLSRLAELREEREKRGIGVGLEAEVLVTSHQHDAVEHAVQGFDAGGLPSFLFGRSWRRQADLMDSWTREWAEQRQDYCRKKMAGLGEPATQQLSRDVALLVQEWRELGSPEMQVEIAGRILERTKGRITGASASRLIDLIQSVKRSPQPARPVSEDHSSLLLRLHQLLGMQRLEPTTFAEDGFLQASRLLRFLETFQHVFRCQIPEVLRKAAAGNLNLTDEPSRDDWQETLSMLAGDPARGSAEDNGRANPEKWEKVLTDIQRELHAATLVGVEAIPEILQAFIEDLDDMDAVKRMIEEYSPVAAATCQQSASLRTSQEKNPFAMVIVDEAARANPLDLLIPMSRGSKIVLVGDHEQLPQMMEPELVERFRLENPTIEPQLLEQSLFERLFRSFKACEERGGPRRVVTLTDDFRMHPSISALVSRLFYNGTITARCTPTEREHQLGLYGNKPFSWIDLQEGPEHEGRSKSRHIEAEQALVESHRILRANSGYTLGIITFYQKQAQLLDRMIQEMPLDLRSRILCGTVDAFQGREFDVVILSTVRSNTHRQDPRNRVGFLAIRNRLCVAFSRAKRLLVTIGDSETLAAEPMDSAVPEFVELLKICQGSEGHYERR